MHAHRTEVIASRSKLLSQHCSESEHQSWHASAKNKRYAKKLSNKGARGMPGSVQWLRSICNDKPCDNYWLS